MKRTRFFRIFSLVSCFLLAATSVFAQQGGGRDGNFPDISYTVSPTRSMQTDLVKQMTAMPEFGEFYDALTARIDEEYVKASNKHDFPAPVADYLLDKVREAKGKTKISSKDVIELFFSEFELIQVEVFAKKAYDAGIFDGERNSEIREYVRLTIVTKFSPAELSGLLDLIKPMVAVDMIKSEENDFLVGFSDPNKKEDEKVFLGGRKLENRDDYAVVISFSRDLVERKLDMMQSDRARRFLLADDAPVKSLRIGKGVFEVIKADIQKKIDSGEAKSGNNKDAVRIVEQIDNFSAVTRDMDGKTCTQLRLALTGDQVASDLKDMADGGKAMLRFMAGSDNVDADAKKLIDLLLNTEIVRDGATLTATINWSSDEFLKIVKDGLVKATAEINKKK